MIEIDVQQIPNQEFIREVDGTRYNIRLRTFQGITLVDIKEDDEVLKYGVRACPNKPIIPYDYLTKGGNFAFICLNGDYPYYTKFGITQQLVYLTDDELKEITGNET
jgi:hypothetical protein